MSTETETLVLKIDPSGMITGEKKATESLKKLQRETDKTADSSKKAGASISKSWKVAAGAAVVSAAVVAKFYISATKASIEFESSMADLSAITGATGKDLQFLSKSAREMGASTTFSAQQAAEAFKLVASAKPDLLESGEALRAVTQEVLTLGEAAGITLPDAARVVGSALNQFGAGAESAARFVNVLAAGAKFGASEIEDTAEALKNSGAVAANVGLSFEETGAAIQLMANNAIKGADAGTGLRNVLLILESQSDDKLKPSLVGVSSALVALKEKGLDSVGMLDLFGRQNITAATALVNQADKLEGLTKKMTGTNTATDQAIIKNATLAGDLKRLGSTMDEIKIKFGLAGDGARVLTQTFDQLLQILTDVTDEGDETADTWETIQNGMESVGKAALIVTAEVKDLINWFGAVKDLAANFFSISKTREEVAAKKEAFKAIIEGREKERAEMEKQLALDLARIDNIDKEIEKRKELEEAARASISAASPVEEDDDEGTKKKKPTIFFDPAATKEALEKLQESLKTREEIENEFAKARFETIKNWRQMDAANEDEANKLFIREKARHEAAITSIEKKERTKRQKFDDLTNKQKLKATIGSTSAILSTVSASSRKMFETQKAFALAEAVATLPAAVIKSFNNGGGYPWGLIPAGAMLATGLQNIQQIKSSSFGGGGGGGSVGGGGVGSGVPRLSEPAPTLDDVGDQAFGREFDEEKAPTQIVFNIAGDVNGDFASSGVLEKIKQEINDNDFVLIENTSRNAQELAYG